MRNRVAGVAGVVLLAAGLVASAPLSACSVCRCGDPIFNALGTQIFEHGTFRLAVDIERLEKSQGIFEVEHEASHATSSGNLVARTQAHEGETHASSEDLVEERVVATLSYAPTERLELVARLPWSQREISAGDEVESASGMADPELLALFRAWASDWETGIGLRSWLSVLGGVKTDWGENRQQVDGERIDEHLQSGTGSIDPFVGLSWVRLLDTRSTLYASAQYRRPGRNDFGYRYGEVALANLGYERKLGERFSATVELNVRDAAGDEIDAGGEVDPNTGGAIAYASPRLLLSLGRNWVARLAAQLPVWDDLDGEQEERAVVNVGITTTF